jgi:hypothetical protein
MLLTCSCVKTDTCSVHDPVFGHVSHAIDDVASEPTAGPSAHSHDLAQSGLVAEGVVCACGARGAMVTLSLGGRHEKQHAKGPCHWTTAQLRRTDAPSTCPNPDAVIATQRLRIRRMSSKGAAQHWLTTLQRGVDRHDLILRSLHRILQQSRVVAGNLRAWSLGHLRLTISHRGYRISTHGNGGINEEAQQALGSPA